ncbi:MAG: ABC transporter permease [Desulfococcus sp.]|nr:MAG: ABC transporter permease [Desulfococcus sp.]
MFLWFLAGETRAIPPYLLPHPLTVGETACTYILAPPGSAPYAGRFLQDAAASLLRVFPGFFIAAAAGLPAGVISGRMPAVRRLLGSSVSAARAVPGICWLPLALVWFGIGRNTTIFLVALAAFFPIYLNALTGVKSVDPVLLRAGAMLGTRGARSVFRILLPAAMPQIVGGLRLGLGLSWAYLVLGELTGVPDGLGAVIMDARMLGRIDIILVGIILIALLGRLSDLLLVAGLKTCLKSARRTV